VQVAGVSAAAFSAETGQPSPDLLGYALLVASAASLWLVRWHVIAALAGTTLATGAYFALNYTRGPFFLALLGSLILAVVTGHKIAAWITAAIAYVGLFTIADLVGPSLTVSQMISAAAVLGGVLLIAQVVRSNRDHMMEMRRRRTGDERLRIAREVHDVVGHHISLINVQAGVALHLLDDDPEQARVALTAIKTASKDTLRELRAALGVLRDSDEQAPRSPAPSISRLDELTERLGAAGLRVEVSVTGVPHELPAHVDLAAYRIVQESLTNAHRHASVDTAHVTIGYEPDELMLDITDHGRGGSVVEGNGLSGIRERVASLGGTVAIGPRPSGGFTVCAVIPIPDQPDSGAH
jgi:signal transduction histidine kinase